MTQPPAPKGSLARRLLCLLPPLRDWFAELDRLASEARQWRTVRSDLLAQKIIAESREVAGTDKQQAVILDFLAHLTPRRAVGFNKIRLGRDGDGGYVMLDDFAGVSAALSFGISDECSWDTAMAQRGIDVHQYDHTVDGPPTAHARFRFYKKAIAAAASEHTDSIGSALAKLPAGAGRVILKIDIEGAEWEVLDAATPDELGRFSQIVGEFHGFDQVADPAWRDRAQRVLAKLRAVFDVVHVHGNNVGPVHLIANVPVPWGLELTLVNRSIYQCRDTDEIFPTALDQPNWAGRPDIFLGSMRFR